MAIETDAAAGGGDDTIIAGAGDDLAFGGGGSDSVSGGDGADIVLGDDGVATLSGASDEPLITRLERLDATTGAFGDDGLSGGAGADLVIAGDGDDTISGGDDADLLSGDQASVVRLSPDEIRVSAERIDESGSDLIEGGAGRDVIYAGANGLSDVIPNDGSNDLVVPTGIRIQAATASTALFSSGFRFSGAFDNLLDLFDDEDEDEEILPVPAEAAALLGLLTEEELLAITAGVSAAADYLVVGDQSDTDLEFFTGGYLNDETTGTPNAEEGASVDDLAPAPEAALEARRAAVRYGGDVPVPPGETVAMLGAAEGFEGAAFVAVASAAATPRPDAEETATGLTPSLALAAAASAARPSRTAATAATGLRRRMIYDPATGQMRSAD